MLLIKDKGRVLFIREVRHKGTNIIGEKRGGIWGVLSGMGGDLEGEIYGINGRETKRENNLGYYE